MVMPPVEQEALAIRDLKGSDDSPIRTIHFDGTKNAKFRLDILGRPAVAGFLTRLTNDQPLCAKSSFTENRPTPEMNDLFIACETKPLSYGFSLMSGCPPVLWTGRGALVSRSKPLDSDKIIEIIGFRRNREYFSAETSGDGLVMSVQMPTGTLYKMIVFQAPSTVVIVVKDGSPKGSGVIFLEITSDCGEVMLRRCLVDLANIHRRPCVPCRSTAGSGRSTDVR